MRDVCHILVVEDNEHLRTLLETALGLEGYRFTTVGNAAEARREIAQARPNLLIVDVRLPGGEDGLSLAKHARAHGVPTILITGDHTLWEALRAAGFLFLLKPFRLGALSKMVDHVLRSEHEDCALPGEQPA